MFGEAEKEILGSLEKNDFIRGLDDRLGPYYESRRILMGDYFAREGQNFVYSLPFRCWNEKAVVDFSALDLIEMGREDSFRPDKYAFVARQLEDETKHYLMLSRIYSKHAGKVVRPIDVKPYDSQKAIFSNLLNPGEALKRAIDRFAGEGAAYHSAKVTADVLTGQGGVLGEIGRAYGTIAKDEWFHKKLGEFLLTEFADTVDRRKLIEEMVRQRVARGVRMSVEMYGYNKEAMEICRANYDIVVEPPERT